jgi:nicotinamidase-related amidase
MKGEPMTEQEKFLTYIDDLFGLLSERPADQVFANPEECAILSIDVTNAFCREGNLSSERVATIINPITDLMTLAWDKGVRNIILAHDCHSATAEEFEAFAPHAVCGTSESEAVDEIKALPFYDQITIFEKNSIDPSQNTGLDDWIRVHPEVKTYVVVGDCTDLCIYQTAMHLRTFANSRDLDWRILVPENCVDTYDLPVEAARELGVAPHDGDLLHKVFLYHMALNAVEVVKEIV